MKDNLCAHCMHAVQVACCGFFCDETGYTENKTVTERCDTFEPDALSDMTNQIKRALIEAYPNDAMFTAVRHGQWRIIDNDWNCWRCTCCGEEWVLNDGNPSDNGMMFCPHCGAKMDGGAENGKTD